MGSRSVNGSHPDIGRRSVDFAILNQMIFSGYTVSVGVRYDLQIVTLVNFNDVIEKYGIRLSYRKGR